MVRITDDGVFDAPIDKVWKYVDDGMMHNHTSFKMTNVLEQKGNMLTVQAEVNNPGGKGTHKETWKFVFNRPKGFDFEYLSGPMKGSRHTHSYTAMGNRTKVEVVGDFRAEGMDDAATKKAVLAYFQEVFAEDSAALKKYK